MHRLALVLVLLAMYAAPASACPASANPCRKYMKLRAEVPPDAYVHSVRGAVPTSAAAVARFLAKGTWWPSVRHVSPTHAFPQDLAFRPAATAAAFDGAERLVIVRRIEKQTDALLVEIDGAVWKLVACGKPNKGYACLVPAGTMAFSEVK